jgi:hypothetical protein
MESRSFFGTKNAQVSADLSTLPTTKVLTERNFARPGRQFRSVITKPSQQTGPLKAIQTNPSFYKKFRESRHIQEFLGGAEVEISKFFLAGGHITFSEVKMHLEKNGKNPHEFCFLCPQYTDKASQNLTDFQLTVTGSFHKGEEAIKAAMREVHEEIGMIPDVSRFREFSQIQIWNREIHNFFCEIDSSVQIEDLKTASLRNAVQGEDDKTKKVQIFVFGKFSDLESLMMKDIFPLPSNDTDFVLSGPESYLTGFRLVSFADMEHFLSRLSPL